MLSSDQYFRCYPESSLFFWYFLKTAEETVLTSVWSVTDCQTTMVSQGSGDQREAFSPFGFVSFPNCLQERGRERERDRVQLMEG